MQLKKLKKPFIERALNLYKKIHKDDDPEQYFKNFYKNNL